MPTPPSEYIRYENQTFELLVRERTVDARTVTYKTTVVANDSDAFRSAFVTTLDEDQLTDAEHKLLEQTIDDGYPV